MAKCYSEEKYKRERNFVYKITETEVDRSVTEELRDESYVEHTISTSRQFYVGINFSD
jgi:hypothetical protein